MIQQRLLNEETTAVITSKTAHSIRLNDLRERIVIKTRCGRMEPKLSLLRLQLNLSWVSIKPAKILQYSGTKLDWWSVNLIGRL
jgi:hypothetical protein